MGDTKPRTEENYSKAGLTDDERKFFSGIGQVKYVLMLAENWCGDVHRNSPMIARIVEAMPGAEMRVLLRDQHPDLTECFLNNGYRSIPIVVFFDKDWNEVGRWIERAGTATQRSFAIRASSYNSPSVMRRRFIGAGASRRVSPFGPRKMSHARPNDGASRTSSTSASESRHTSQSPPSGSLNRR